MFANDLPARNKENVVLNRLEGNEREQGVAMG